MLFVSGSVILLTMYGLYKVPPFIAALTAATCCIAVTLTPWPKDVVASSTGPTLSNENNIPLLSPFKSMFVFSPNPKAFIYLNSLSFPNLLPNSTKPGLQEFCTTSKNVWFPCPPFFQHFILAPSTFTDPPS